jgi:hypothetical protein
MIPTKCTIIYYIKKGKAVPLQAWSGPEGSSKLRFPDNMKTAQDGGKVVSLTYRPPLSPGNIPGTHFCQRLSRPQGHSAIGRIISTKNSNDAIWNRNSDLPICKAVPWPLFHNQQSPYLLYYSSKPVRYTLYNTHTIIISRRSLIEGGI